MRSMSIEACTCASKFHNYRIRGIIKLAFSKILDIEKFHKIYSNKIQKDPLILGVDRGADWVCVHP